MAELTFEHRLGACPRCQAAIREVGPPIASGPLKGHPSSGGKMFESATNVEFLLSDGSEVALTMCRDCATALDVYEYGPLWDAVIDRTKLSLDAKMARDAERAQAMTHLSGLFLLAPVRRRVETPDGQLVVDRRG